METVYETERGFFVVPDGGVAELEAQLAELRKDPSADEDEIEGLLDYIQQVRGY